MYGQTKLRVILASRRVLSKVLYARVVQTIVLKAGFAYGLVDPYSCDTVQNVLCIAGRCMRARSLDVRI